jgi:hypothetical protein
MSGSERRSSRRVTFFCEAHFEGFDVAHTNVRLADLSVDGAFVDARTVLPPGAITRVRFTLLDEEVSAKVEVRYSMPGMGMGIRFLDLSPAALAVIERFVSSQ